MEALKAKGMLKKKSSAFAGVLPNITGRRDTMNQTSSSVKESQEQSRYAKNNKNETDAFNKSIRMS